MLKMFGTQMKNYRDSPDQSENGIVRRELNMTHWITLQPELNHKNNQNQNQNQNLKGTVQCHQK